MRSPKIESARSSISLDVCSFFIFQEIRLINYNQQAIELSLILSSPPWQYVADEDFKTSIELLECMFNELNSRPGRVKVLNSSGNNIQRLSYPQRPAKKKGKKNSSGDRTNDHRERACILRVHPKSRPMRSSRVRSRGGRYEEKEERKIGAKATVASTSCATRRGSYAAPPPCNWGPTNPTECWRRWGSPYVRPWKRPGSAHPASGLEPPIVSVDYPSIRIIREEDNVEKISLREEHSFVLVEGADPSQLSSVEKRKTKNIPRGRWKWTWH